MQPNRIQPVVLYSPCETRITVNLTRRYRPAPRIAASAVARVAAVVVRVLRAVVRPFRSARVRKTALRSRRPRTKARGTPARPRRTGEVAAGGDPR